MFKYLWLQLARWLGIGKTERSADGQQEIDNKTRHLSLYCAPTCVFCLKVRLLIRRLNLKIQIKNVQTSMDAHRELVAHGGRSMVPCLCIQQSDGTRKWMYESSDINRYLRRQFGHETTGL